MLTNKSRASFFMRSIIMNYHDMYQTHSINLCKYWHKSLSIVDQLYNILKQILIYVRVHTGHQVNWYLFSLYYLFLHADKLLYISVLIHGLNKACSVIAILVLIQISASPCFLSNNFLSLVIYVINRSY